MILPQEQRSTGVLISILHRETEAQVDQEL